MKAMFGDVLNQVMETELETKLGYEKVKEPRIMTKSAGQKTTGTGIQKNGKNVAVWDNNRCSSWPERKIWAFYHKQIQPQCRRNEGKIFVAVFMWYKSKGYFRADKKPLRCWNITEACQQNKWKNNVWGYGLAKPPAWQCLSICIYGWDTLQS